LHLLVRGLREACRGEDLVDPGQPRAAIGRWAREPRVVLEVLPPGQVPRELGFLHQRAHPLEGPAPPLGAPAVDPLAEHLDLSPGREDETEGHADHRGLAGAVRPEEAVQEPLLHREVERVECSGPSVDLGQPAGLDRVQGSDELTAARALCGTRPATTQACPARSVSRTDNSGPVYGRKRSSSSAEGRFAAITESDGIRTATIDAQPCPKVCTRLDVRREGEVPECRSGGDGARIVFTLDPGGGVNENTEGSMGSKRTERNVDEIAGPEAPRAVIATRSGMRVAPSTSTSTAPTRVLGV